MTTIFLFGQNYHVTSQMSSDESKSKEVNFITREESSNFLSREESSNFLSREESSNFVSREEFSALKMKLAVVLDRFSTPREKITSKKRQLESSQLQVKTESRKKLKRTVEGK